MLMIVHVVSADDCTQVASRCACLLSLYFCAILELKLQYAELSILLSHHHIVYKNFNIGHILIVVEGDEGSGRMVVAQTPYTYLFVPAHRQKVNTPPIFLHPQLSYELHSIRMELHFTRVV